MIIRKNKDRESRLRIQYATDGWLCISDDKSSSFLSCITVFRGPCQYLPAILRHVRSHDLSVDCINMDETHHNLIKSEALGEAHDNTIHSIVVVKEPKSFDTLYDSNILQRPHSLVWRFIHGIHYLMGGVTFIIGSCMYFPNVYQNHSRALAVGGWLFTIGSVCFLVADLQEWWYHRVGCICDGRYRPTLEHHSETLFALPSNTLLGRYRRAKKGINSIVSLFGSALYLAGSILFIPTFENELFLGGLFFIIGSAAIFVSQSWKVYRSGCTDVSDRLNRRFRFVNLFNDPLVLGIDFFGGLGGLVYFIGTILFLADLNTTDTDGVRAAIVFVCGGVSFTLAGILLHFHYYCARLRE
jgi:hypothetical protein